MSGHAGPGLQVGGQDELAVRIPGEPGTIQGLGPNRKSESATGRSEPVAIKDLQEAPPGFRWGFLRLWSKPDPIRRMQIREISAKAQVRAFIEKFEPRDQRLIRAVRSAIHRGRA